MPRMPCRISDGPQTPEDVHYPELEDEDLAYERQMQADLDAHTALADDLNDALKEIALMQSPKNWENTE